MNSVIADIFLGFGKIRNMQCELETVTEEEYLKRAFNSVLKSLWKFCRINLLRLFFNQVLTFKTPPNLLNRRCFLSVVKLKNSFSGLKTAENHLFF